MWSVVQAEALAESPCQGWGTCVCTFVGTPGTPRRIETFLHSGVSHLL